MFYARLNSFRINKGIFILIAFLYGANLRAQDGFNKIINSLLNEGLENVKVLEQQNHLYLTYENNRYRFEADALAFVIQNLQLPATTNKVSLMIQNRGIGIVSLHFNASALREYNAGTLSGSNFATTIRYTLEVSELEALFEKQPSKNSSFYKADLIAGIDLDYFIGDFTNSIRQKINFQPSLSTVLGRGTEFLGVFNMPYFNEMDNDNFNNLRVARFSQDLRFKNNQFLNISLGYFNPERFGFHARYDKLINEERLRLRMDFGITRFGMFKEKFKVATNYLILYPAMSAGLTYRWIKYNTDISFRYGIFSNQDLGYKLNYTRQMGLTYIGLFMNKTTFGETVGFKFQAPLGFKKHLKPKRIRVRTKEYFDFVYTYDDGTNIANDYFTGDNVISQLTEYYPSVLKGALKEIL